MSDAHHRELMERLGTLLKVQSLSAVRHLPTKKEKILFLAEAGLAPKEIAPIVGSSAASVSQTVYEAKKSRTREEQMAGEDALVDELRATEALLPLRLQRDGVGSRREAA